jgi:aspartate aminotransferase
VVYPGSFFEDFVSLIRRFEGITVVADEVYRSIRYDEEPYATVAKLLPERTLYVSGISKELSATGLRLGFVAGPREVAEAITRIEGNTSSCVNLPTQKGLAGFLAIDQDHRLRQDICRQLQERRDRFVAAFASHVPEARLVVPKGAFYAFPDLSRYIDSKGAVPAVGSPPIFADDRALALTLLKERGVACIPGSSFHRPGHLRFAYALGVDVIEEGLAQVGEVLRSK